MGPTLPPALQKEKTSLFEHLREGLLGLCGQVDNGAWWSSLTTQWSSARAGVRIAGLVRTETLGDASFGDSVVIVTPSVSWP